MLVVGLNYHLAYALCGAHDIRGVDRLIRRDEHETLYAELVRRANGLERAEDVIFDGLVGVVLHKGHVLMRRGMVDDIRMIPRKHGVETLAVPDRAYEHLDVDLGMCPLELVLDSIGVVFVDIENDELMRRMLCYLAAQLAADRTGRPPVTRTVFPLT